MDFVKQAKAELARLEAEFRNLKSKRQTLEKKIERIKEQGGALQTYLNSLNGTESSDTIPEILDSRAATLDDIAAVVSETGEGQAHYKHINRVLERRGTPVGGVNPLANLGAKLSGSKRFTKGDGPGYWRLVEPT